MSATPLWELSKENAAPLERGRNVKALEASFAAVSETQRQQLEKVVQKFESRVAPTEETSFQLEDPVDDPLIHWVSYIKFHQENFPSDTHAQFLLFERCMRALCRIPKYSQDPRFVRVCCLYAEKTQEPTQVFKHLYQQKIGTELAMFWMAFSFVAEKDGDYRMAKNALDKGIRNKAKPVQQLENRLRQFQRRMARHWLNATQDLDEMDSDQDQRARGVLGALSEDEVRRNDRGGARRRPVLRQRMEHSATQILNDRTNTRRDQYENETNTIQGFAIFEDGENGPSENSLTLDESSTVPVDRVLERQEDRIKENRMSRQRWNEQGAYAPTYNTSRHPARPPVTSLPAFAIHVDEDCAAEHQRQEAEARKAHEIMRRNRDERAFREREHEDVAERLRHDPLMYVKDPARRAQDKLKEKQSHTIRMTKDSDRPYPRGDRKDTKKIKRRPTGYQIKLLRGEAGQEQSFEEARAAQKYYTLLKSSTNFSVLPEEKEEARSSMSLDESDISMHDDGVQIQANEAMATEEDMVLPTPRNTSTASSVVDETFAVGATADRVEQTINTKIAVNELSMMFTSPSIDMNGSKGPHNRSIGQSHILNQSAISESAMPAIQEKADDEGIESATFSDLGQSGGVNSSFAPLEESPPKQFQIFQNGAGNSANKSAEPFKEAPFSIYVDEEQQEEEGESSSVEVYQKERTEKSIMSKPFSIHNDEMDGEDDISPPVDDLAGDGETVTFSIFGDSALEGGQKSDKTASVANVIKDTLQDTDINPSAHYLVGDGDTATFSIFTDAKLEGQDDEETATFSIFQDGRESTSNEDDETASLASLGNLDKKTATAKRKKQPEKSTSSKRQTSISYSFQHAEDLHGALGRIQYNAKSFPKSCKNLFKILSEKRKVYKLTDHCLPRCTKKAKIKPNEEIRVSKSTALVEKELGRGAYGVVTLLKSADDGPNTRIAMKSQTMSDSLAWEYEILQNLQKRVGTKKMNEYPFPVPYSFLLFQDGSLMTMSPASTTGLTLLDLVNNYKTSVNHSVMPEILAIHYASRMLHHIEILHYRGNILHCDVKADNWVLVSSFFDGEEIDASDVQLLDFGRAVDMTSSGSASSPRDNMYTGQATRNDMRCVAMRQGKCWSFDVDTYGVCDTVHTLLFGENMELDENKCMPKKKLHRYHQRELWGEFFSSLMKLEDESGIALGSRPLSVRQLRQSLESYLEGNKEILQAEIKHQATFLWSKRPS